MKKLILIFLLSIISIFARPQVSNNFESGNWVYYYNLCWGIGPDNSYYKTKVTANSNQGFNNTKVCETDNLGQFSPCVLESPWVELAPGNLLFDHAVPSFDGTRSLKVFAVQYNTNIETQLGYTIDYINSVPISTLIPINITGIYKIKWQWEGSGGHSRGQLDNILIPGTNVSDPSNNCTVIVQNIDTDGDGVPDTEDEYPTDPDRAYNNYYPAVDTSTLAFEDLWPSYGDYDFNDLVVGYKFKIVSNAQHNVVEIFNTLVVRADGAGLNNGFIYEIPTIIPQQILSISGVGDRIGYDLNDNGTETSHITAVIPIFDNTHKFMSEWNTIKGGPICPEVTFNVYIKFADKGVPAIGGWVNINDLNISRWNPFIIKNGDRGMEIHLPDYPPTNLADTRIFGMFDDNTIPSINKYYKSKTNLPWALDIVGKFEYPIETEDISGVYLHFAEWCESGGTQYMDWWYNKSPGYRDDALIY